MNYIVTTQQIDTEKKTITFYLTDEVKRNIQLSIGELKQKMRSGEIDVVNFKLEGDKLKYTNGFFKPMRTLTDEQTPEAKYVATKVRDKYILYNRDGKEIVVSKGDFEYLARKGKILNAEVVENIDFSKMKLEAPDRYNDKPHLEYDGSVQITKENFAKIKGIIRIYYKNSVYIKDEMDRLKEEREYMEPRKFWSIIKQFNNGKMDYTAEDIEHYADKIKHQIFLYIWFNMTDDEFSRFYTSFDDFEGTVYSHDCITKGRRKYFEAIKESDDGFRQAMCTFLCLYGEQGCKEFIQDPSGTIEKYKIPVEALCRCYIFGY